MSKSLQDGMLLYYLSQVPETEWYVDRQNETTFFDFRNHLEGKTIMPSKSPKQARLMAAAAHTKGGYGGVPQKVGREFVQADSGSHKPPARKSTAPKGKY